MGARKRYASRAAEGDSVLYNWKLKNTFIRKIGKINDELITRKLIDTVLSFNISDLGHALQLLML